MDYYDELGLTRSAGDADVKKSYRKLALKYHPQKDASPEAAVTFARVAEAYDVLSSPKTKGFYDLYGEEGLKRGIADGKGGTKGGFYVMEPTPLMVFESFFGTSNPYAALQDISGAFENMTTEAPFAKGKQKTYTVGITLEEIYFGCQKKVAHEKKVLKEGGEVEIVNRTLSLTVAPGTLSGQRYVFDGEGNEQPKSTPGPVVVVLQCEKHASFSRKGSDLVYTATIPVVKALCGMPLLIKTLDGRTLTIPLTQTIVPGQTKLLPGEGMPKADGSKGDLMVVFEVLFPETLSESQKAILKAAFFLPAKPSDAQKEAVAAFLKAM